LEEELAGAIWQCVKPSQNPSSTKQTEDKCS